MSQTDLLVPPGHDLVSSDFQQLELRMVLYFANKPFAGTDAFTWLVQQTGRQFHEAAAEARAKDFAKDENKAAREMAKIASHSCLTGDHEVLTPTGWIPINAWQGDAIAEWDKDRKITFRVPKQFHTYKNCPVYEVTGKNVAFSQVVTGSHRIPLFNRTLGKTHWIDLTPETWDSRSAGNIPVSGTLDGPEVYSDFDLFRAIAIQADGSRIQHGTGGWRFHIKKARKVDRLQLLFNECPKPTPTGTYKLAVKYDTPLLTSDKKLTWEFIANTSLRQKLLCLDEFMNWDGSRGKTFVSYTNSCVQSLNVFQTLAHLAGKQSKINRLMRAGGFVCANPKICYRGSVNRRTNASKECIQVTKLVEHATTYCFTTSTGYFMVRHRGHISVTGNSNYGVGLQLLRPEDLRDKYNQKLFEQGALRIYHPDYMAGLTKPWTYGGKVVSFTGAHLAEILYKDKSVASRAKALVLQEDIYFKRFFEIREWQMKVLAKAEASGYAQIEGTGRYLRLLGSPEETAKVVLAFHGQGGGAEHVQGIELKIWKTTGRVPILQVHDELVFSQPAALTDDEVLCYIKLMEEETRRFPGFRCPIEAKRGFNWKDMRTIYKG